MDLRVFLGWRKGYKLDKIAELTGLSKERALEEFTAEVNHYFEHGERRTTKKERASALYKQINRLLSY